MTSSKKIIFIAGTLGSGGAERQLYYILQTLKSENHNIQLISLTHYDFYEPKILHLGIPIIWAGRSASRIRRLACIATIIRSNKPDIVQSQHFHTNLYSSLASRLLNCKDIGAIRNDLISEIKSLGSLGLPSLKIPKLLAANSLNAIETAQKCGVPKEKLFFLPNVIDTSIFQPRMDYLKHDYINIISVGRLAPQKRYDRLIHVAKLCKAKNLKIRFYIYGEGPMLHKLLALTRSHNVDDTVFFMGLSNEIHLQYLKADIILMTSDYEGTPNVIMEGMACGLPVVSTDVGDISSLVSNHENGYICEVNDIEDMVDRITTLAQDYNLRIKMGKTNSSKMRSQFSLEKLPSHLMNLYARL